MQQLLHCAAGSKAGCFYLSQEIGFPVWYMYWILARLILRGKLNNVCKKIPYACRVLRDPLYETPKKMFCVFLMKLFMSSQTPCNWVPNFLGSWLHFKIVTSTRNWISKELANSLVCALMPPEVATPSFWTATLDAVGHATVCNRMLLKYFGSRGKYSVLSLPTHWSSILAIF